MQLFLKKVVSDVFSKHDQIANISFVLPNKRAGLFLKEEINASFKNPSILPEVISIEDLIEEISQVDIIEYTNLIFEFYSVYIKHTKNEPIDSFVTFSKWARILLQDFNEIDSNLVDASDVLDYITDIKRIENWDLENSSTELTDKYFKFFDLIKTYYHSLRKHLSSKALGYQGLAYRIASERVHDYLKEKKEKQFIFIGFNALNKAEEYILQEILKQGFSHIYFDSDMHYMDADYEAGKFLRNYKENWNYFNSNSFNWIENNLNDSKKINIKGYPKNISQIKGIGQILKELQQVDKKLSNTAVVLCNENLLPILLNSLPKEVQTANITMGYNLQNVPLSKLFHSVFKLHSKKQEQNKGFYHKDFMSVLKHPVLQKIWSKNLAFQANLDLLLVKNKKIFITYNDIKSLIKGDDEMERVLTLIFLNWENNIGDILLRFLSIIDLIKNHSDSDNFEKEYLFRFHSIFQQLINLHNEFGYLNNLDTLYLIYQQLLQTENLFFQGEPLMGLQIMGMLESRVLDFENIIISSANEGFLPAQGSENTFIPFEIKLSKGLPSYQEKDAIFSYHFYRLIQRAKNVYILYNTEADTFGSGEVSRFVTQLKVAKEDQTLDKVVLNEATVNPKIVSDFVPTKEIKKSPLVIEKIKKLFISGLSPSTLAVYLKNPFDFYKQKILNIKEVEEVEELIAPNTFGTIIHETLYTLYKPLLGKYLTKENLVLMKSKVSTEVRDQFKMHFSLNSIKSGKNYLSYQIAKQFVNNFLNFELNSLARNKKIKILDLECKLNLNYEIEGLPYPVKLKGIIDRVDEVDGVLRILDYKTGVVNKSALKIKDWETLSTDFQYSKSLQILFYAYLYKENKKIDFSSCQVEGGIIAFKNLNAGFMKLNNSLLREEDMNQFLLQLNKLLLEIYNCEIPFIEKEI